MISVADVVQPTQDTTPVQTPTAAAAVADAVKSSSRSSSNASTPVYTSTGSSSTTSSSISSSTANNAMAVVTCTKASRRHNKSASHSESETASIALEEIQAELMQVLRLQQQRVEAAEHKLGHAIVLHDTSIEPGIGTASDLPRLTGPECQTLTDHHKERSGTTKVDAPVEMNERVRSKHASHHAASRHMKGVKKEAVDMSHNTKDTTQRHQPHVENTRKDSDDLAERPGSPLFHPRRHTRGVGQDTHTHAVSSELARGAVERTLSGEREVTCGSPIYHEVTGSHNDNNIIRESGDGSNSPEYERFLAQLKDQQRQHHEVLRRQRAMRAAAAAAMPHTINNVTAQDNKNENRNNEEVEEAEGGEATTMMRQGLRFVHLSSHDQACRSPPLALMHHVVGTPSSVENGNERGNAASSSVTGQAIEIPSQRPVMRLDVHWQKDTVNVTPVRNSDVSRPFAAPASVVAGTPLLAPPPQLLVTSTNDTVSENNKADESLLRKPYRNDKEQQNYTSDNRNASAEVDSGTSDAGEEGNVRNERRQAGRMKRSPVEPFADVLLSDNARHQRRDRHTEQQQHKSSNADIAQSYRSAIVNKPGAMSASVLHNEANEGNTNHFMASRTRGPSSSLIPEHGTVTPHSARLGRTLTQHKHQQQQQMNGGVAQNALAGVRQNNNTSRPISTAALRRAVEALWQERGVSRHRKPFHGIHTHTTQVESKVKSPPRNETAGRPNEIDRQLQQTGSVAREHDTHLISYLPHNAAVTTTTTTATKAKVTPHDEEGDVRAVSRYHFADSLVGAALADVFPDLRRRQRDVQRHLHSPRTGKAYTTSNNINGVVGLAMNDMGQRKHDVDICGSKVKREQRKAAPHTSDEYYYYYYDRGFRPVPAHLTK